VESFGLSLPEFHLADGCRENVRESIRVSGKVGIPVLEYDWYA
jgi:hypothetical protein